jgi:NhaP-type Na+/H+ or K+/H+ antiporter
MTAVLVFALTLLAAALVSDLAHRSVLSTAALFLVAGFLAGPGMLGLIPVSPGGEVVGRFAELALFAVLFTDGMRVDPSELRRRWLVPTRALLLGMPLTLAITAVLAYLLAGVSFRESLLVAAVLSPTDPVFAAALVGRQEIPRRLRHMLNIESGVNDGVALPLVVLLLAWGAAELHVGRLALEVAGGIGLGIALPWAAAAVERSRFFSVGRPYEPMFAFAVGLLLFATASLTHANEYLAAFAGGATISVKHRVLADAFARFGESVAELLKLAAVMVFGPLISPGGLGRVSLGDAAFVVLTLVLARPVGLGLALIGSHVTGKELAAALWFGPKGFASVVFGLLVLHSGLPSAPRLFQLVALVVAASILAHSSSDVLIANRLEMKDEHEPSRDASAGHGS